MVVLFLVVFIMMDKSANTGQVLYFLNQKKFGGVVAMFVQRTNIMVR